MLGGVRDEESALAGLTTLMVRTALKGTSSRSAEQIAEEGELLGGSVSGAAGADSFRWSISVPSRHAAAAVELLADVVQHPTFGADVARDRARHRARRPRRVARRHVSLSDAPRDARRRSRAIPTDCPRAAATTRCAESRWTRCTNGTPSARSTSACVIALVGDANPDDLAELAARAFNGLRRTPVVQIPSAVWPSSSATAIETRDRAQTAMALLFSGPSRSDPARYAAAMIARVASGLGGRFFDELRDKRSLCYTVNAFVAERALAGTFGAYIATSPEQEGAARDGLLAEFARLRDEPVTEQELRRAQTYAIGLHAIRQQSGAAVLADAVDAYLFGSLGELEEYEARIRAVTPAEMQSVAHEHFDPARRVEGIVRGTGKRV